MQYGNDQLIKVQFISKLDCYSKLMSSRTLAQDYIFLEKEELFDKYRFIYNTKFSASGLRYNGQFIPKNLFKILPSDSIKILDNSLSPNNLKYIY